MVFKPLNFRRITESPTSTTAADIRSSQYKTLILIKADGSARYGRTRADKDDIVADYVEASDLLLMSWSGSYRTDIFPLDQSDIDRFYD